MDRNIRRRLGFFVSSGILATGLVLAAGGTAFASDNGGNGGGSWAGGIGCNTFICNHPTGVGICSPVVTWCGAPKGWDLARWLGCPAFSGQLLDELFHHATNCQSKCSW